MQIKKKLLLIFFIALIVRLISLTQSLWLDEATTARVVQQFNFLDIVTKFSPQDFHPPLYYLFLKVWTSSFGFSEIALRMPSVLFSLLAGYLVYLLGRRIKNEKVGVWAALFFLFNPLIIYYSQEARMYMMTTFFLSGSLYCLLACLRVNELKKQNYKFILFFTLFAVASFYTFYGAIFLIIPMFLYLFYKRKYAFFLIFLIFFLLSLLIIGPLLYHQLIHARESLGIVANWKNVLGTVNFKNLLLIPLKFSIGRINFNPKWAYWAISGVWTVFIWLFVLKGGRKNRLFLFLAISPLIIAVLFSFFSPLLQYFRFLYLIPLVSLLLGQELHLKGVRVVVLAGFLLFSLFYLLFPQFHREDWKNLSMDLPSRLPLFMVYSSSDPIQYYRSNMNIHDFSELTKQKILREIVVVPYTADIHGVNYQENLAAGGFKKVEEKSFRGIVYEKWSK
ncbi:hypothetical protein A2866_06470 [Candidatus Roizmanbacteria bacterium RIFCSPHIGHO2_01_FULL_39_8]|nr:MAG: hypothetical protein A2866_06470 [Candidatus Roizmanbacteria bacterium RIFCSPHIGHO2_01_FULL_39_8]